MSAKKHFTTRLVKIITNAEASSFWSFAVGEGQCANVIERLSLNLNEFTPEESDLLIISGTVNRKMLLELRRIRERMLVPNFCVALGSCVSSCGRENYAVVSDIEKYIKVDVFVPGCPVNVNTFRQSLGMLSNLYA